MSGDGGGGTNRGQSDHSSTDTEATPLRLFRRRVLQTLGATGLGLAASGTGAAKQGDGDDGGNNGNGNDQAGSGSPSTDPTITRRVSDEHKTRRDYSRAQLVEDVDTSPHASNARLSETVVVSKFGKSLPHDGETGLPTTDAYETLADACEAGSGYESIPQASENLDVEVRPLVQPESAWTYQTSGGSTAQLRIAHPPAFDDPETGAEMVELYWRALTRDVNFYDYESSDLVAAAAAELDSLDAYDGPGSDGTVTPENVFRGVVPGAATGPYVSQFLWKDRDLGGGVEDQKIEVQTEDSDYATTVDEWLDIQRGVPPGERSLPSNEFGEKRYIISGRDMCERVHDDPPFRQLQKAAQVLIFTMNAPLDGNVPYTLKPFSDGEGGERNKRAFIEQTTLPFNDFGPLYIEKKVLEASEQGQLAAWHKKWNVHRRLRPEEYGGRIQAALGDGLTEPGGVDLEATLPDNILSSADEGGNGVDKPALFRTKDKFGSYLLPQAYAEGSPTHPSYPAGHSAVAGAGVTVLKALFDGGYEFPAEEKVVPTADGTELRTADETDALNVGDTLTVRGELNKLASNMALGRNRAGIHYRTDGIEGLRLGEAAAIRYLEDQLSLSVRVGDIELSLETFDGDRVTIQPSA